MYRCKQKRLHGRIFSEKRVSTFHSKRLIFFSGLFILTWHHLICDILCKAGRNSAQKYSFSVGEIWKSAKTNPNCNFPKFDCLSEAPFNFGAVFIHFVMKLSEKSFPTSIEMYVGGLIYQEKLVATSFQWAEALQRFCSRSQGVVALVSVSDGKIQITILILRRGALSNIA